jgi:hypothetical protein
LTSTVLERDTLAARYDLFLGLNPYYQRGLLDGDTIPDVAVQIFERATGKRGIAIIHGVDSAVHILGAGTPFGTGGDDFKFLWVWRVEPRGEDEDSPFHILRVPTFGQCSPSSELEPAAYIAGSDRSQAVLLPEVLDDFVGADNPVRFLEAFVAQLDLGALGFERAVPAETGRPGYDPGDLLRLYLYGYLHRIRSSRRLEQEACRSPL